MSIRIQPSRFPKGEVADVQNYAPEAATAVLRGQPMDLTAGEVVVTTNPVGAGELAGFALEPTTAAGVSSNPSGLIGIAKAKNEQIFAGTVQTTLAGAPLTAPGALAIGIALGCGISTHASNAGEWVFYVTAGTGFVLVDTDDNVQLVFAKAIVATLQPAA